MNIPLFGHLTYPKTAPVMIVWKAEFQESQDRKIHSTSIKASHFSQVMPSIVANGYQTLTLPLHAPYLKSQREISLSVIQKSTWQLLCRGTSLPRKQ